MTIRRRSDQWVFAVADCDIQKADSADLRTPGANPLCVAEVHVDGTGMAE